MKHPALALAGLALALTTPAMAADPVSFLGTWKGMIEGVGAEDGWKTGEMTFVFTEQRGRAFKGDSTFPGPQGVERAPLFGSVGIDGKSVAIANSDGAYSGTMPDADTLDVCYTEPSSDVSAKCMRMVRQK